MKKGASKIAAVLAGPSKAPADSGSSPEMEAEGDEYSSSSAAVDAAQGFADAMASGSAEEIASAFKQMLAVCME